MTNLNKLLNKLFSNGRVIDPNIKEEQISSYNLLTRLQGPFGIDYSDLKAKGTLQ